MLQVQELLVEALQWLATHSGVSARSSLVTDRSFLVKAPRVIRAAAALAGRGVASPRDLLALRHMTTFRVPPSVHEEFRAYLEGHVEAAEERARQEKENNDDDGKGGGEGRSQGGDDQDERQEGRGGETDPGPDGGGQAEPDSPEADRARQKKDPENRDESYGGDNTLRAENLNAGGVNDSMPALTQALRPLVALYDALAKMVAPEDGRGVLRNVVGSDAVEGVERVMASLHGRNQRNRATAAALGHGAPRRYGRLASLDLADSEAVDLAAWLCSPVPQLPRGLRREPRVRGGSVAFLRDVSDSMWGGRAVLASAVTQAAINLARKRKMRFGYAEFSSAPELYMQHQAPLHTGAASAGPPRFFGRDYDATSHRATRLDTDGFTNLQVRAS